MADKKEINAEDATDAQAEDVDNLLNSALQDFKITKPDSTSTATIQADMMPPFLSQGAAQQAASDFQNMLKQLAKVQEEVMKSPQPAPENVPTTIKDDDQEQITKAQDEMAAQFLKNLQDMQEKAGKVAESSNPEDFFRTMDEFQQTGLQNDFMPFMHGLMTSLLSKEMMYPSLSEMVEKYPKWLDDNKASISEEDYARYTGQLGTMKQLIAVYDNERDTDSEETKMRRFDAIMQLMQKMQMAGHPPAELVGDMPPGWDFDSASGLPTVNDPKMAAENGCSIM